MLLEMIPNVLNVLHTVTLLDDGRQSLTTIMLALLIT